MDICFDSGFGSVARFNAAFRTAFAVHNGRERI
jgi:AraC-like DNA-binding protein